MSLIKQFAGQTVIYGLGSVLSRIVFYLTATVLLGYLLGDNTPEFGRYAYFYAYAAVFITLFSFRLDTALFRYGNKQQKESSATLQDASKAFDTTLTVVIFSACLTVLGGLFLDETIADLIEGFENYPQYIRWFGFIVAFDILNLIPFAKLRLTNQAKSFALYKIFNVAILVILILFFLVLMPKMGWTQYFSDRAIIEWVFIANVIASGVLTLALLPVMKGYRFQVDFALLKKMTWYVFPLVIVGMANAFIQFFSVQLQKTFLVSDVDANLGQAGIYDFTRRIAGLFVIFTTAFNYAAEPFFFNNSSAKDRKQMYGKICRLFVLVGGVAILGLYLGLDLIKYLAEENFRGGLYLLPVLLMAYMFLGIYYNVSIWYKLSDQTKYGAIISMVGVVITLAISIVFLPRVGSVASAWATFVTYGVMVVLGYVLGQKHFPIDYPVAKILRDLCIISVILVMAFFVRKEMGIAAKYIINGVLMLAYLTYVWNAEKVEWKKILNLS